MLNNFKKYFKAYFLVFLLISNIIIFFAVYYTSSAKLTVAFLDVGQGDAIFIKAPDGRQMLIDGGANSAVLRELGKVMPFYDRSIDVVLATHPDQDHIGGLVEVLKRFQVDLFIKTNTTATSDVYSELEKILLEKNVKQEIIIKPEIIAISPDVEFDILFPTQSTVGWEANESSIVGKLIYGDSSFLLTGDSPQIVEKYLIGQYGDFLKSDVLKAGHHGSKTSSAEEFLNIVSPAYTIISAGLNNKYNHPSPEVLDILAKLGDKVLQTLGGGTVKFEADGRNLKVI